MENISLISERCKILAPHLDKKSRRLQYATECKVLGQGGIAVVSKGTGVSPTTISTGKAIP